MHIFRFDLSDSEDSDNWIKLSDKEKVLTYFECQFGDDITIEKLESFDSLDDWCEFNHIDEKFVKKTIIKYNNKKNKTIHLDSSI